MKSKSWVKQVRPGGKVVIGVPVECHHIHISIFFLPWPILGFHGACCSKRIKSDLPIPHAFSKFSPMTNISDKLEEMLPIILS